MKTTVEISDALLESARELAAARSTTLRQIIEEGLVKVIDASKHPVRYKMRDMSFGGKGPAPNKTWEEIRDMIYKGRGRLIAVDTNILVYAHRTESEWHQAAREALDSLCSGAGTWAIPWPCAHEFLSVVTHPRIYAPPTPVERAFGQLQAWLNAPSTRLIGESKDHLTVLEQILLAGKIAGPAVHDARIAAICVSHGVKELWTVDRGFSRMAAVRARNPLLKRTHLIEAWRNDHNASAPR